MKRNHEAERCWETFDVEANVGRYLKFKIHCSHAAGSSCWPAQRWDVGRRKEEVTCRERLQTDAALTT